MRRRRSGKGEKKTLKENSLRELKKQKKNNRKTETVRGEVKWRN